MFLFRLGGTLIKGILAALALAGAVTPFYFYAAWYEMEPPEPMRSFVGPVLGPGMVARTLLGLGANEGTFRERILWHISVILGSVAFWLLVLAGLRAMLHWVTGDRTRRSPGAVFAVLSIAVMAAAYAVVTTRGLPAAYLLRLAYQVVFVPGFLLNLLIFRSLLDAPTGLIGHLVVVGGSWGAWALVALLVRRLTRSRRPAIASEVRR